MKTGVIAEGGGMKCAFTSGVLDVFIDNDTKFDYTMGVSAGAACIASYLGGQKGRNRRFFVDHIDEPGYFGVKSFLKTGDLFGLDYIYSDLTNEDGGDPLDFDKLMDNPAEFVFPATDAQTGKPYFFSKEDLVRNDYKAIKATCALPAVCKPIEIGGHKYFDGGVSDSIPYRRAFEDGCDRLVIIMTKPYDYKMQPQKHRFAYTYILHRYPRIIWRLNNRADVYNDRYAKIKQLAKTGRILLINPSDAIKLDTYTMDKKVNQKLYEEGVRVANKKLDEIRSFIDAD